jgi:hypothetical protein
LIVELEKYEYLSVFGRLSYWLYKYNISVVILWLYYNDI